MNSGVSPVRRRAGWVVALLAAFVSAAVMSVTASAANPNIFDFANPGTTGVGIVPDPQTTNYPGQAAIGQTLRFSYCVPTSTIGTSRVVTWSVANWTGDDLPFLVDQGSIGIPVTVPTETCFFADYGSHKPGLLDLKVFVNATGPDAVDRHHNFLGIWQEIYDVTLSVDDTGKALHKKNPAKYDDPNMAGKDGVPVIAKVRGSFPLGNKGKKGGKSTVILPDDFGWLAQQFAIDGANTSFGGVGAAYRWDIHDDQVINQKKKGEAQHPYCQTFYPWTDSTGYNLYKLPPTGNKVTSIPHPYYCNPDLEKRPTPKVPDFFTVGLRIETAIDNGVEIINFATPTGGVTQRFVNPFTRANMVPWPANDEDSVTNPIGGLRFSDILGRPLPAADPVGPFDQRRQGNNTSGTESNYYPNGVTDAGDATSPEWRIDFQIQQNGTGKGTKGKDAIDGAGFLAFVDKNVRTHVDKNGDEDFSSAGLMQAEEQTGPFHSRFVPALTAAQAGVGTTNSPGSAQNTNGYLNTTPRYDFWTLLHEGDIDQNRGRPTACTEFFSSVGNNGGVAIIQNVRHTPGSIANAHTVLANQPDLAAVYADEHGQGEVQLKPGRGFYYDQLPWKATSQYGCDLQGINILGTSKVVATVYYPDQWPVGYKQVSSNPIQKQWKNGFNAQLSFAPKGGNNTGWRITAWKTDIDGNAPNHKDADYNTVPEVVCISAPEGTVTVPPLPTNLFNNTLIPNVAVPTSGPGSVPGVNQGPHVACAKLATRGDLTGTQTIGSAFFDIQGPAGQEVFANFVTEQIKRSITLSKKSGGNPPPVDGNGKDVKPGTFPKKAAPTTAELKGAGLLTSTRIAKVNRAKYKKIKTRGKVRKGIVFMKVQSPTTKAKVRISLMGLNKNGSWITLRTYKRVVKANTKKFVRAKIVGPAKLAKRVRRVETSIIRTAGRPIA